MVKNMLNKLLIAAAVCGTVSVLTAGPDIHLNGHFRGAPDAAHIVPGWSVTPGGTARLLPSHKPGKFLLELIAPPQSWMAACSELHTVRGNMLKIDADVSGRGNGSIGFEAFDAARTQVLEKKQMPFALRGHAREVKFYFNLTHPEIRFVRIIIAAEAGSVARFGDVDAEFKHTPAPVPAPLPPPAPVPAPLPAPAPAPVPAPAAAPAATLTGRVLINDEYYRLRSLGPVTEFQTSVPVGSDIEFKLGEDIDRGMVWSVANSYDPMVCRVKLEHDRDGVWPARYDKAEIELKALGRGATRVEFVNGNGKRVIVNFFGM